MVIRHNNGGINVHNIYINFKLNYCSLNHPNSIQNEAQKMKYQHFQMKAVLDHFPEQIFHVLTTWLVYVCLCHYTSIVFVHTVSSSIWRP